MNPFCENAIEEALRLQAAHGGEIVAFSVGTEDATTEIRRALAMGADRGILVTAKDAELDSDLVARIAAKLAAAEGVDILLLGKQAVDGDSNQVAQLAAEYLGWGQATFASHPGGAAGMTSASPGITVTGKVARVTREVDGGIETLETDLPAVISADLRLNEPRLPTLPNIMKAKRKPLDTKRPADLGVDPARKVVTVKYASPPERKAGIKVASVEELVNRLVNDAKVL
jgi:electron transfer flavoprotein beta subunit